MVRYGTIQNPLHLFQRLGDSIKAFKPALHRVDATTGYRNLTLQVRGAKAAQLAIETFVEYHWR